MSIVSHTNEDIFTHKCNECELLIHYGYIVYKTNALYYLCLRYYMMNEARYVKTEAKAVQIWLSDIQRISGEILPHDLYLYSDWLIFSNVGQPFLKGNPLFMQSPRSVIKWQFSIYFVGFSVLLFCFIVKQHTAISQKLLYWKYV